MSDAQLVRIPFSQYLTDDGTSSGAFEMTGDFSGAVTRFWAAPAPGIVWRITSTVLLILDTGLYRQDQYGALAALTNGINLNVELDPSGSPTTIATVSADPVKTNVDWDLFADRFDVRSGQAAMTSIIARFDVSDANPIRLVGDKDHAIVLTLHDNFTGLIEHRAVVSGFVENVVL